MTTQQSSDTNVAIHEHTPPHDDDTIRIDDDGDATSALPAAATDSAARTSEPSPAAPSPLLPFTRTSTTPSTRTIHRRSSLLSPPSSLVSVSTRSISSNAAAALRPTTASSNQEHASDTTIDRPTHAAPSRTSNAQRCGSCESELSAPVSNDCWSCDGCGFTNLESHSFCMQCARGKDRQKWRCTDECEAEQRAAANSLDEEGQSAEHEAA